MRILFLTNFYPPYILGGQERSCQQVVDGMKQRGHQITVLTSMFGVTNKPVIQGDVNRILYLETDFVAWRQALYFFTQSMKREKHNLHCIKRVLEEFQPDVVFIWGMWNLHRSIPALIEDKYPGKVIYRLADYWPTLPSQQISYWTAPGRNRLSSFAKRFLGRIALATLLVKGSPPKLLFEHTICVSACTRDALIAAGVPLLDSVIIHTGIDITPFLNHRSHLQPLQSEGTIRLLYAGRLCEEKGIDTIVRALSELIFKRGVNKLHLNLAGFSSNCYSDELRDMVRREGLADYVSFLGEVPFIQMPALLQDHEILLLPSIWPEPFARIILEGMACGLVVIATPCGGTTEIVKDGINGLLFRPGDSVDLASKILSAVTDPELCKHLSEEGQRTIMNEFTSTVMFDKIEGYLEKVSRQVILLNPFKGTNLPGEDKGRKVVEVLS